MMTVLRCLVLMLPLLALPRQLLALDISGKSRTYLLNRETSEERRLMPLYEYLDLRFADSDTGSVSFNFGGWARRDLMAESYSARSNEDLQYAYLSLRARRSNGVLNFGRVLVNEGGASEQLDGMHARVDLMGGFTLAAFGGSPVETDLGSQQDPRRGDTLLGGRISQRIAGISLVGLSYLDEKDANRGFRRESSADIRIRPVDKVDIYGLSTYNSLGKAWSQHNYYAAFGPFGPVRVVGELSRINYRHYFSTATSSAFTFTNLHPDETLTSGSGALEFAITPGFVATADFKNLEYGIAGHAKYYGGRLAYAKDSFGAGAGVHRMDSANTSLVYDEQGAYITQKIAKADVALSYLRLVYKEPINGVKESDSAAAALGYALTPAARIAADVEYLRSPEFTRDVRAMATLVIAFDFKTAPTAPPQKPSPAPAPARKPAPAKRK